MKPSLTYIPKPIIARAKYTTQTKGLLSQHRQLAAPSILSTNQFPHVARPACFRPFGIFQKRILFIQDNGPGLFSSTHTKRYVNATKKRKTRKNLGTNIKIKLIIQMYRGLVLTGCFATLFIDRLLLICGGGYDDKLEVLNESESEDISII